MSCRLLYLIGQLAPGGSERQLSYLLENLDIQKYRPGVVVWNYCKDDPYVAKIRDLGVPLYGLPDTHSRIGKLRALRHLVRQMRPEVIHSYSSFTNFSAWWATRGVQTIAIGSVRSDFTEAKTSAGLVSGSLNARWPRAQIFNNVTAAATARQARRLFTPQQLFVIRNRLDLQHFSYLPLSTTERVQIVAVGTLLLEKRWDRLLRAARTLHQRGLRFLVRIVGGGPLYVTLQQEAHDLGIADSVEFTGHSNDVPGILVDATFVVHPSDSEGCPNAVMEAMACGRAVVATDVGDVPYLVEDGKTGFVVRREDEAMLVECIATLLTDRELCRRMGIAGRIKAEREFGLDHLVPETLTAYRTAGWQG